MTVVVDDPADGYAELTADDEEELESHACLFTHRANAAYSAVAATATAIIAGDATGSVWFLDWPSSIRHESSMREDKERRALEAAQPACSASSVSLDLATRRSYNRFPMKAIRFTKTNRKMDVVEYEADGKLVARLENPKQGIIPHDLVHAIIESTLGVRGFTDLIFDGQKPEFAMKVDGEAWLAESMVEAIQGMLWSGTLDHKQFTDWVATICSQRMCRQWRSLPRNSLSLSLRSMR